MTTSGAASPLALCGPSGVGKSSSLALLRARHPQLWLSVSVTTRSPRPGEVDGRHYHFVGDDAFDRLAAGGELLEWNEFAGHRYGTPRQPVLDRLTAGTIVLLDVNPSGAWQVRAAIPQALLVFLAPPSWPELVRRLSARGTESAADMQRRLAAARQELATADEFEIVLVSNPSSASSASSSN